MAPLCFVSPLAVGRAAPPCTRVCRRPCSHAARGTPQPPRRAVRACAESTQAPMRTAASPPTDIVVEHDEWLFRGFRCRYCSAGADASDAPIIVLVHGFGANYRHWRRNTVPLAKRGFRVYAVDLLGFGLGDMPQPGALDSHGEPVQYIFEYWAAQLRHFCETIVHRPVPGADKSLRPPLFFVANSIGSMVTMQASIEQKGLCAGHVFISPSLRQLNVRKRTWVQSIAAPIAMRLLSYRPLGQYFLNSLARPDQLRRVLLKAYAVSSAVDGELVRMLREPALNPGALDVFLAFIMYDEGPLPEDLLPQLSSPSLMLWGALDTFEPHRDGTALRHYATVERFVTIPGVGHCAHDEAPDVVNDLIVQFVESHTKI